MLPVPNAAPAHKRPRRPPLATTVESQNNAGAHQTNVVPANKKARLTCSSTSAGRSGAAEQKEWQSKQKSRQLPGCGGGIINIVPPSKQTRREKSIVAHAAAITRYVGVELCFRSYGETLSLGRFGSRTACARRGILSRTLLISFHTWNYFSLTYICTTRPFTLSSWPPSPLSDSRLPLKTPQWHNRYNRALLNNTGPWREHWTSWNPETTRGIRGGMRESSALLKMPG